MHLSLQFRRRVPNPSDLRRTRPSIPRPHFRQTFPKLAAATHSVELLTEEDLDLDLIDMGKKKGQHDTPIAVAERPVRVYVGGIDWDIPVETGLAFLQSCIKPVPGIPAFDSAEMALFGETEKRSARDAGKLHKGHGYLNYTIKTETGLTPEGLVNLLLEHAEKKGPGIDLRFELAKAQPLAKEEIEAIEAREAERQRVREHKRRNRVRKVLKRIEQLGEIVGDIEQKTQVPIRSMYGTYDELARVTNELPSTSAPSAPTPFTAREIDWAAMPVFLDPLKAYKKATGDDTSQLTHLVTDADRIREMAAKLEEEDNAQEDAADPTAQGKTKAELDIARGMRKRAQVESFYRVVQHLLHMRRQRGEVTRARPLIIDYGCGTGALTLCLAWLMQDCDVLGIDANRNSIDMFNAKASAAGLTNVTGRCAWIQEVEEKPDIALALHACGAASDFSLLQAARARAAFSVCPCCVGKLKFKLQLQKQQNSKPVTTEGADGATEAGPSESKAEGEGATAVPSGGLAYRPRMYYPDAPEMTPLGDNLRVYKDQIFASTSDKSTVEDIEHPRSAWMRTLLGDADTIEKYSLVARAGDISHAEADDQESVHHRAPQLAMTAKALLELDRVYSMRERGYEAMLLKADRGDEYSKSDLLVGWFQGQGAQGGPVQ